MKSGKRAICAGPGNPPVVVDGTGSVAKAAAHAASPAAWRSVRALSSANTARSRAAARSAASPMRRSSSERSLAANRAPLAMPCRSVSSGKLRSLSTAAAGASMT